MLPSQHSLSPTAAMNRLINHVRAPLFRNGYALVLSSGINASLGMIYWIIAARFYPAETVGLNSAAISTMSFIASMAQLNLHNALNRFIQSSGTSTRRFIAVSYLLTVAVAVGASIVFLLGLDWWSPSLSFLAENIWIATGFVLAVAAWLIFILQDSVLTGLRQASWVPLENIIYAIVKIGLLVALAAALPSFGIFASWTLPLLLVLFPVNWLIFAKLVPQHIEETQDRAAPLGAGAIARYVAGDYVASTLWLATTNLMPVLVVEQVGAADNAYFYLAWSIAYTFYLISRNLGMSLITEGARDESKLYRYSYQVMRQNLRLLLPAVAFVCLIAPYLLQIFGTAYAREGAMVLRLLSISALPNVITATSISILRVQRRMKALLILLGSMCALIISLSYLLLGRYGIVGIGVAWVVGQSVVALGLMLTEMRTLWIANMDTRPLVRLAQLIAQRRQQRASAVKVNQVNTLLPLIAQQAPQMADWQFQTLVPTVNDSVVSIIGPVNGQAAAVVKHAFTPQGSAALEAQLAGLGMLAAVPNLNGWRALLPQVLASGNAVSGRFIVESLMMGVEGRQLLGKGIDQAAFLRVAAEAIAPLHQQTAHVTKIGQTQIAEWVDAPIAKIRQMRNDAPGSAALLGAIERLTQELYSALHGRDLPLALVHGDYVPGNVLLNPQSGAVMAIIDWERAASNIYPLCDLMQLFLTTRLHLKGCELGDVIRQLLKDERWLPVEMELIARAEAALPGEKLALRPLLLLTWLMHIKSNLSKSVAYSQNALWIIKNVEGVLHYL